MILIEFDWYYIINIYIYIYIWIYEMSFLKHFINCTFIQTALFNLSFPGIQCGMFCRGSFPAFHEGMAWVGSLHSLGSGTSCPRIRSRNWTWRIIRTVVCMLRTSPSWSSKVCVTSSKWWRCKRKENGHKKSGKNMEKHFRRVREVGFQPVYRNGILKPKTSSNHVHWTMFWACFPSLD